MRGNAEAHEPRCWNCSLLRQESGPRLRAALS